MRAMTSRFALIVAMARNRTIGRGNDLPWHIPEDLKYFKSLTSGKPVIMGRKTFDSILARLGKPLPGRPHYIISRSPIEHQNVTGCPSLENAISEAAKDHPDTEIFVIGGASIYEQAISKVGRMYITVIDSDVDGDAAFPAFDQTEWIKTESLPAKEDSDWSYHFDVWDRKKPQ